MRFVMAGLSLVLCSSLTWAADTSLAQRQAEARKQQADLRARIAAIQKEIDSKESARRDAAGELKASESAISDINRRLSELDEQGRRLEDEMAALDKKISAQKNHRTQRQHELGEQLRAQYAGGLSSWTALLSGDDPQEIGRNLSYLGYITQAQAGAVRAVRQALDELDTLQKRALAAKQELESVSTQTTHEKKALEDQKSEREKVLVRIESALQQQRSQAEQMAGNEKRLGALVSGLDVEIRRQEEARKAEEARRIAQAARKAEEARQAALEQRRAVERAREAEAAAQKAQAQAERQQQSREAAKAREQVEHAREQARQAEKAQQQAQARQSEAQRAERDQAQPEKGRAIQGSVEGVGTRQAQLVPQGGFQGLGKQLPSPVKGEIQGKFGAQRPEGGLWRGIVLRAPEGTKVHVVAPGRVVYANWLAGFGNILIVDHGAQYLSVYAYNQSLLKQVGDVVKSGDAIATVGATGGQVEPGLYFEIRHQGTPVNPLLWLTR